MVDYGAPASLVARPARVGGAGAPARAFESGSIAPGGSYLGIGIQEITADRAKALRLREEAGVEITRVGPDSPADKAGLKAGDVVLRYNGTKVEGLEQLSRLVRETPVGREAKLDIFRNGAPQAVTVKIGQHPPGLVSRGFRFPLAGRPASLYGIAQPDVGVEAGTH